MGAPAALALALLVAAGAPPDTPPPSTPPAAPEPEGSDVPLDEHGRPARRVDIGGLPLVNFNTDFGFGGGANLGFFIRHEGYFPYQYAIRLQTFFTTGSTQNHFIQVDMPQVLGSPYRLTANFGYNRDLFRPYYGLGNVLSLPPPEDPSWKARFFSYRHDTFEAWARLRRKLTKELELSAFYSFTNQDVTFYEGSLLGAEQWGGAGDGRIGIFELSAIYDNRDSEASATRGYYATLAVRGGAPFLASSFTYWGANGSVQGYHSFFEVPYLVIAERLKFEGMWGDVPIAKIPSIGGGGSLRGMPRLLYEGNLAVSSNTELRSRVVRFRPGGHMLDFWLVGFFDVGRVWADGVDNGPALLLHSGAGGGFRVAWEQDYVVRFDYGWSEGRTGFYIDFGQVF